MNLSPSPRNDKDLIGHSWQDWFFKLYELLKGVSKVGGHWYLTNGATHAVNTSAGMLTASVTVANTVTETILYSYTFVANELHADEAVMFRISGVVSNASAADDYTVKVYLGGTLLHTLARIGGNVTDVGAELLYTGTIRTDGASGTFVDHVVMSEGTLSYHQGDTTTHAIDTTTTQEFKVTATWAAAKVGNTMTCTQGWLTFYH